MERICAHLKIWVDPNEVELREKYAEHVKNHNEHIETDEFPNSGFDLLIPEDVTIPKENILNSFFLDCKVKTEMKYIEMPAAYYVFVRSSFSKTPLILSNHVGVIDAGYRGNVKIALRNLQATTDTDPDPDIGGYRLEKYKSIAQICHPFLCPVRVEIVDSESDLSTTSRGSGGFGSTGK